MLALPASEGRLAEAGLIGKAVNYGTGIRSSAVLLLLGAISSLIALLMIVTLAFARRQSPHNLALTLGLNHCGNTPCFRGMIPGVTGWEEVRVAFNRRTIIPFDPPDGEIRLYPSRSDDTLGRILIRVPKDGSLSVSDIVRLYGAPCGVTIYPQMGKFMLRYPSVRFTTPSSQGALRPETPIVLVEFDDPFYTREVRSASCSETCVGQYPEPANRRWYGFGSIQRYLTNGAG